MMGWLQVSVVVAAVAAWQQLGPHAASGIEEVVKILHHQQEPHLRCCDAAVTFMVCGNEPWAIFRRSDIDLVDFSG